MKSGFKNYSKENLKTLKCDRNSDLTENKKIKNLVEADVDFDLTKQEKKS